MGHIDTAKYIMPFGKHRGESLPELPSGYLRWLAEQDWFEEKFELLMEAVNAELAWRDEMGQHWEDAS